MKQFCAIILVLSLASCNMTDLGTQKFFEIERTLSAKVEVLQKENEKLMANPAFDSLQQAKALEIRERTKETLAFMNKYQEGLLTACSDDNKPDYVDYKCQMNYALGSNQNGEAYKLEAKLNTYAENLSLIIGGKPFEKIAIPASEIPEFKDDPNQRDKDFVHLNFEKTPLIGALAILAEFRLEVLKMEKRALIGLSKQEKME